jgi:cytochrome d ubiquinol oxidase subunit II
MTALGILWYFLIGLLIAGYLILDGFDLGMGVLYPFLGKNDADKAMLRRSVGPVWDGNEVWLLTAGGGLFAAFAPAYATTFSGFYLAIMLVLFGLIIRAVALEFRGRDEEWGKMWDLFIFLGSLLPALLFGVALGNIMGGIPLNANGDYTGNFFGLLTPFALVVGVLGLTHIIQHGAAWIRLKTTGDLSARAAKVQTIFLVVEAVVFILATVLLFAVVHPVMASGVLFVLRIVFLILVAFGWGLALLWNRSGNEIGSFIASVVVCIGFVGLFFSTLFPNFVVATDPSMSITIANAAGSELALTAMTIIACIGVPLVLVYHFIVYKIFFGKVSAEDAEEY